MTLEIFSVLLGLFAVITNEAVVDVFLSEGFFVTFLEAVGIIGIAVGGIWAPGGKLSYMHIYICICIYIYIYKYICIYMYI
jgi:hypothetical protein